MSQTEQEDPQPTNADLIGEVTKAIGAMQDAQETVVESTKKLVGHLTDGTAHGAGTRAAIQNAMPVPVFAGTSLSFASQDGAISTEAVDLKGEPGPPGDKGTVFFVDDAGGIHINWDNGEGLAAVWGQDRIHQIDT